MRKPTLLLILLIRFPIVLSFLWALGLRLSLGLGSRLVTHLRLYLRLWLPLHLLGLERRLPVHLRLGRWRWRLFLVLRLERRRLLLLHWLLSPESPRRVTLRRGSGVGRRRAWGKSLHLLMLGVLPRSDGSFRGLPMLAPGTTRLAFFRIEPFLWYHSLGYSSSPRGPRSYCLGGGSFGAAAVRDDSGCGGAGNRGNLGSPVLERRPRLHRRGPKRLGHVPLPGAG
jgi:hypothetical protein